MQLSQGDTILPLPTSSLYAGYTIINIDSIRVSLIYIKYGFYSPDVLSDV